MASWPRIVPDLQTPPPLLSTLTSAPRSFPSSFLPLTPFSAHFCLSRLSQLISASHAFPSSFLPLTPFPAHFCPSLLSQLISASHSFPLPHLSFRPPPPPMPFLPRPPVLCLRPVVLLHRSPVLCPMSADSVSLRLVPFSPLPLSFLSSPLISLPVILSYLFPFFPSAPPSPSRVQQVSVRT